MIQTNIPKEISYTQEIYRKGIHLLSLSIPICNLIMTEELILSILIPIMTITVVIDLLSRWSEPVGKALFKFFGPMLRAREHEKKIGLNGASWVFVSAVICIWLFPKLAASTGFAILIISDISAALIGRRYGRIKFWGKSLEGCAAFFISALIVVAIIAYFTQAPSTYFIVAGIAALFGAVAEASATKLRLNDNISIPVTICLVMIAGEAIVRSANLPVFLNLY